MDIIKLHGVIKPYEWGDSYFISSILNRRKSNQPQGELWMGTHPMGVSSLVIDDTPLTDYIDSHPTQILGESHIKRFRHEIPFLLKVLAIQDPLSLQVHPNSEQALAGYERESIERGSVDPSLLNYKDNRQKDEVLFALTPVTAMVGFRSLEEIMENLTTILEEKIEPFLHSFTIKDFFQKLIALDDETKFSMLLSLKEFVEQEENVEPSIFLTAHDIAKKALTLYPDDIMCFSPFFLNIVHLEVGSLIHVKPTTLHAYVYGHGVELMSASDNVIRGGLTNKKVDVKELLSTLSFYEEKVEIARVIELSDSYYTIDVPSKEFTFSYLEKGEVNISDHDRVEIAFVASGSGNILYGEKEMRIKKGDVLLIPSIIDSYSIQNSGLVVIASVPKGY